MVSEFRIKGGCVLDTGVHLIRDAVEFTDRGDAITTS